VPEKVAAVRVVAVPVGLAPLSPAQAREEAVRARNELVSTLEALESRLNLPRRLKLRVREVQDNLTRLGSDKPAALAAVAVGALAAAGTLVWIGIQAARKG
jgi:hypothetical protein